LIFQKTLFRRWFVLLNVVLPYPFYHPATKKQRTPTTSTRKENKQKVAMGDQVTMAMAQCRRLLCLSNTFLLFWRRTIFEWVSLYRITCQTSRFRSYLTCRTPNKARILVIVTLVIS
jgi:hypothetical protein